ncbi:MAG TPA: hypothetical protein PLI62_16990 [Spirochaetota bacterium]|nr:hypothetical protein [Spirochaetota bacterium]
MRPTKRRELKKIYRKEIKAGALKHPLLIQAVKMAQDEGRSLSADMIAHCAQFIQSRQIAALHEGYAVPLSSGMDHSGKDAPGAPKSEGVNVHAIGQGEPTTERTEGTEAMTDTTGGHEVPGLNGEGTGTTGKAVKRTRKARRQRSRHEVPAPAGEGAGAE